MIPYYTLVAINYLLVDDGLEDLGISFYDSAPYKRIIILPSVNSLDLWEIKLCGSCQMNSNL
jgi:hypothetical protein